MTAAAPVVQPFSGEEKETDNSRPSRGKVKNRMTARIKARGVPRPSRSRKTVAGYDFENPSPLIDTAGGLHIAMFRLRIAGRRREPTPGMPRVAVLIAGEFDSDRRLRFALPHRDFHARCNAPAWKPSRQKRA
jgi:hypothetical protein